MLSNMDLLKIKDNIEDGIEEWSKAKYPLEFRNHLGISEIGDACNRKLYYKFHWMFQEQFDGRMRRLFARGHREEEKYINYLEGIGFKVYRFDNNGKQFRVTGVMGHYGGSCDGVGISPWFPDPFILECKTHNTKSFTHYVDKGLQLSKPKHYDQMCGYGEKMQIQYGLYFPENKNDDDIKVTPIELDWARGKQLEKKAEEIITANEIPPRISDNPSFFECKYCSAFGICHENEIPLKNCRSCKNSLPTQDATWTCLLCNMIIPNDIIPKACDKWIPI